MSKKLTVLLSMILILSLCAALAACGEKADGDTAGKSNQATGAAVGDAFRYEDIPLTVKEINDGKDAAFSVPGSDQVPKAEGKYVTVKFDADMSKASAEEYQLKKESFICNGKEAAAVTGQFERTAEGEYNMCGMIVLFDVTDDTGLDQLELKVQ